MVIEFNHQLFSVTFVLGISQDILFYFFLNYYYDYNLILFMLCCCFLFFLSFHYKSKTSSSVSLGQNLTGLHQKFAIVVESLCMLDKVILTFLGVISEQNCHKLFWCPHYPEVHRLLCQFAIIVCFISLGCNYIFC